MSRSIEPLHDGGTDEGLPDVQHEAVDPPFFFLGLQLRHERPRILRTIPGGTGLSA